MIAIINIGANINSLKFALAKANKQIKVTLDQKEIIQASHVILPGVGAAAVAMESLQQLNLIDVIRNLTQPVLGICLGMQLLYEFSEEGQVDCLKIVEGTVKKLLPSPGITIPHMGWNQLELCQTDGLFKNIANKSYVYFTHSYAAPPTVVTTALANYNQKFTAAMQHKNFFATQFHPEKSGEVGEKILENFVNL